MKNPLTLLIAILIALVLLAYMFCFQVRYDESAVRTTFNRATEADVIRTAGLRFKIPLVHRVYKYPRQIRTLEMVSEQINTFDSVSVIVEAYLVWKIDDPLKYFNKLKNDARAEAALSQLMRQVPEVIGTYRFDQLVNTDPTQIRLEEIETLAGDAIRADLANYDYGIEVVQVGIRRILLPDASTKEVFNRMKSERQRMAQADLSRGEAEATRIRSEARSASERIMSFAQREASLIETRGKLQAAGLYAAYEKHQEFAIFLRELEALKAMLEKNTYLVLDANKLSPVNLFTAEPDAVQGGGQ